MVAASWLDHKIVKIVKGIGRTPGDQYSAEPPLVEMNLMGGIISLVDWSPEIPQIKNGGVWTESPTTDGRQLQAGAAGNVVEKITIQIAGNGYLDVMKALSGLNQIASDCRDFWQTDYQIDPVYLVWWAGCGVGEQYALISTIDVSPTYQDSGSPTLRVDLSLEREPYWRGIPPGANPKIWTYYINASHPQYNINTADLMSGTDHLINGTVSNKFEWSPAALGAQVTPLSQNYIDVSGSLIPGDAPALLELSVFGGGTLGIQNLYMGISARKTSGVNHLGTTVANSYNLAAGDGEVFNGATKVVAAVGTGLLSNNSAAVYYNVQKALVAADSSYAAYLIWGVSGGTILRLDRHFYSGTFAVFLRAKAGTDSTSQMARVTFFEYDGFGGSSFTQFSDIPLINGGVSTTFYPHYVGTVTLPLTARETVSVKGYGTAIRETASGMYIQVELKNSSGANRTTTILDLVMIPIDPSMTQVYTLFGSSRTLIDNTGYLQHGRPDAMAQAVYNANSLIGNNSELRGTAPTLAPKVDQRIYFLESDYVSTGLATTDNSIPDPTMVIRANIVPRWAGIRDS